MPRSRRKSDIRAAAIAKAEILRVKQKAANPVTSRPWHGEFLALLADGRTVAIAATMAGMSKSGVCKARKVDPDFAQNWQKAWSAGVAKRRFERFSSEHKTPVISPTTELNAPTQTDRFEPRKSGDHERCQLGPPKVDSFPTRPLSLLEALNDPELRKTIRIIPFRNRSISAMGAANIASYSTRIFK